MCVSPFVLKIVYANKFALILLFFVLFCSLFFCSFVLLFVKSDLLSQEEQSNSVSVCKHWQGCVLARFPKSRVGIGFKGLKSCIIILYHAFLSSLSRIGLPFPLHGDQWAQANVAVH